MCEGKECVVRVKTKRAVAEKGSCKKRGRRLGVWISEPRQSEPHGAETTLRPGERVNGMGRATCLHECSQAAVGVRLIAVVGSCCNVVMMTMINDD